MQVNGAGAWRGYFPLLAPSLWPAESPAPARAPPAALTSIKPRSLAVVPTATRRLRPSSPSISRRSAGRSCPKPMSPLSRPALLCRRRCAHLPLMQEIQQEALQLQLKAVDSAICSSQSGRCRQLSRRRTPSYATRPSTASVSSRLASSSRASARPRCTSRPLLAERLRLVRSLQEPAIDELGTVSFRPYSASRPSADLCNSFEDGAASGGNAWTSLPGIEILYADQVLFEQSVQIRVIQFSMICRILHQHERGDFMST